MKYRLIKDDEAIVVILGDGGIAEIHEADEIEEGDGRQSVTEYYQSRFTMEDSGHVWDAVGEGKMYYNDWKTPFDDPAHVQDALEWLAVESDYELDESIWPDLKI